MAASLQTIRWGIIGIGRFGRVHADVLHSLPGVELTAIARRDAEQLTAAGSELGVERRYTDYRQLLADPQVDAVSITTHWQEHCDTAIAALEAGKHVLLEKPMAADADECRRVIAAAERARGRLMVGHVCRFDPRITQAKAAIDAGQIGRIVSMHARRNLRRAPGHLRLDKISPLVGDGVHDADLMMWFTGAVPDRVVGRTVRVNEYRYPDIGWAMLDFGPGCVGVIETVWCLPENTPFAIDARTEIIGSQGAIYVDCGHTGVEIHSVEGITRPDTAYWPRQHGATVGALAAELAYFADCIRRDEPPQVITPTEAARAVRVVAAAEQSAESGVAVLLDDLR